MTCPSCKKPCAEKASFCGFCGSTLGGNGFREDLAATIVDYDVRHVGGEQQPDEAAPGGAKAPARGNGGNGWKRLDGPLHDTLPNYAIDTVVASDDELASAVAETRGAARSGNGTGTDTEAAHAATMALQSPRAAEPRAASASELALDTVPFARAVSESEADTPGPTDVTKQTRTPEAETKTKQAETKTKQAETEAKQAETEAKQAEAKAKQAEAKAKKRAEKELEAKERKAARATLPARRLMRLMMALFGLGLLGIFATPWLAAGLPSNLGGALRAMGFIQLFPAAAGLVLLLAAALPLPYAVRALTAAALGLTAIGLSAAAGSPDWRRIVTLALLVILPAALLHRARHRRSILARVLVGLSVAGLLATLLVPAGGSMPVAQMIASLGAASFDKVGPAIFPLALLPLCALSLLAFLGSKRTGFSRLWAFALLVYLPLQIWVGVAVSVYTLREAIETQMGGLLQGVSTLFFITLGAYGISQLLWKMSGAGKQQSAPEPAQQPVVTIPPTGPLQRVSTAA